MTMTVTGTYDSDTQIKNVRDVLIANGIPQEQIFVDQEQHQIKVMAVDSIEPEIEEILKLHNASSTSVSHH